jgi:CHAD domain-containing protein
VQASPEREVKLSAAPAFHVPDLSGLAEGVAAGPEREARQETTYYDTGDLRLARWGLSFRFRGGEGWTLKLAPDAGGGSVLTREEVTFPGQARKPPDAAVALVRAYLRGAPLEPVARLSTLRRRVALLDRDGRELAEVVDDEVSVLDGRRVAARFREVEVELRQGGDQLLPPLLARLQEAGAARADPTPKHVRALGPAALQPPDVSASRLPPHATAADLVRNALAAAAALIFRNDPLIRLGGDPEYVHQARVGTRRLRSHLRTFRPLLEPEWTNGLRQELGWLADELGPVRDREVMLERLTALATRLPASDARAASGLMGSLEGGVEEARRELLEAMSSQRYFDLLDRLVAAASQPRFDPAVAETVLRPGAEVLPRLAIKPWRDLRRAVHALGDAPPDPELHRVRILAKRARYAAEGVAPAVGPDAARFGKLAAGLQDVLGEHQDSVTAQGWLRANAGGGRRAFVAGELYQLEADTAQDSRRRWPMAWASLDRKKLREWMTA